MENQEAQTVNLDEQTAQTDEQPVQSTKETTDWKALHDNEVDYNKKLRGKNQTLESKVEQYEKEKAAQRQKKLEADGEYNTILAEKDQQIEALTKKANEFDSYRESKKAELLDSLSESDRESFSHLPLQDIEKLSKRLSTKTQNVANVPEGKDKAAGGEFGGYSSYVEWAQKDPNGYEEANKLGNTGIKIGYGE